jgi:uncharacterized protein (TIGR03435 family)
MSHQSSHENIPLDADEEFTPTGGLFSAANIPLHWYIRFAYKLSTEEFGDLMEALPRWALTTRYDIEARATGNPTKDQYRLMVQSLLADRFKLVVRHEEKQGAVWMLVLNQPGKLGPKLRRHQANIACPTGMLPHVDPPTVVGGFPEACGVLCELRSEDPMAFIAGARDVSMAAVANYFSLGTFGTGRPVVDKTGLEGNYDFVISFLHPEAKARIRDNGGDGIGATQSQPAFADAIKDQLGLKLVSGTASRNAFFVDHIEHPSPN